VSVGGKKDKGEDDLALQATEHGMMRFATGDFPVCPALEPAEAT